MEVCYRAAVDRVAGTASAADNMVAVAGSRVAAEVDTMCWTVAIAVVVEATSRPDLEDTSLAAALMVESIAVVALVDCSSSSPLDST